MKRIISAILMLCTLIFLASCGGGEDKKTGKDDKPANIMAWAFHSFEKTVANVKPRGNDFSTDYTVYLSKGETEGCQVAIYSDKKIENATLTKKSGGADNIEVSVFSMNITHSVSKYQYTDSLIPYSGKALTLEAKTILPFMIEFKTNENTEAGEHNYVFEFKDGDGKVLATYNVTVHVWDFELPNEKTFVTAFGLGKHWIAYQGIYNEEIHAEWYDIMLEHNMCAYEIPYDILDERANDYMSNPRVTSFMVPIPKNEDGSIDEAKLIATYNKLLTNDVWLSKAYFYPLDEPKNVKELAALKEWEKKLTALCPKIEIMAPYYILTLFCPKIAAVSIDNGFLACQQFRGHGDIVLIGSSHFYRVDNTAVLVHTNMSLVAEMPCVSLFHLMCIRVTLLLFIFCGTRGRNDCGIYDRSFFQNHSTLHQQRYNLRKQFFL